MSGLVVEILSKGEARERVTLVGPRVVVGSGPSATWRLAEHEDLADAHLVLEPSPEGCEVTLVEGAPGPLLVDGLPHDDGVVPWGAEVAVGSLRLRLTSQQSIGRTPSLPLLVLTPVLLGVSLFMLLDPVDDSAIATAPPHPALLDAAPPRCQSGHSPARHRAERDEHAARAKSQRYPFAAHDGVQAVRLYQHAGACYADSGDAEAARQVRDRAARLEARLGSDYDTARFRLSRALTTRDWSGAAAEARLLLELLSDRPGPYTEWLGALERRLRLLHAQEGADR